MSHAAARPLLDVTGRCAVVTGAASGIGRALAVAAARRGMDVAMCDVSAADLEETAQRVRDGGGRALSRVIDIRSADAVTAFAADVAEWSPSVALVFANAGIMRRIDDFRPDLAAWDEVIDVNLRGAVHTIHAFMGRLLDRNEPAQFVITGSQASFSLGPQLSPYVATKHALWGLAETLRYQLVNQHSPVGVSLFAPGRVQSAITDASRERVRSESGDAAAAAYEKKLITPDEAAEMALERAVAREFWILASGERFIPMVRDHFDELLAAEPTGWLGPLRQSA